MITLDFSQTIPQVAEAQAEAFVDAVIPAMEAWSAALVEPTTRVQARLVVGEILRRQAEGSWPSSHLKLVELGVSWSGQAYPLVLALPPSVFAPEDWSRTFLEGLLRRPARDWEGASVVEIGTGSGWISIALSRLTPAREILALDLNPEAVAAARLNVRLAALGPEGELLGKRPLWERIECVESNLLSVPLARGLKADVIIGCIPQVLQPEELTSRSRTQALYDLSNYATLQGVVEDAFGLGLNAAALDQAFGCLSERGAVVLNLAVRPGVETVRRMFLRRGLRTRTLWRARIRQAADTAIDSLVALETRTGQDFEFYLHHHSPHPVPAATAREVLKRGGEVWHELKVVEGRPALGERAFALVSALTRLGVDLARQDVDLAQVDDEQATFMLHLAARLETHKVLPYPHEAGDFSFREKVAAYLTRYTGRRLEPGHLFVGPGRASSWHVLLLSLTRPGQTMLVSRSLRPILQPALSRLGIQVIPAPDAIGEVSELLRNLSPDVLALAVTSDERQALGQLSTLLDEAARRQIPVVIDETDFFEITSRATGGGLLGALADFPSGAWPIFLVTLEKSRVYQGLAITLVCHPDPGLHTRLEAAAEATYSRIAWLPQFYYEGLFAEMTMFRMWEQGVAPGIQPGLNPSPVRSITPLTGEGRISRSLTLPGLSRPAPAPSVVRLDYGENEAAVPDVLIQAMVAALLDRESGRAAPAVEVSLGQVISRYVATTRGMGGQPLGVVIAAGTWPALFDTLEEIGEQRGRLRVAVPRGCYGMVAPQLQAAGAELVWVETRAEDQFRIRPAQLRALDRFVDVVLLNQPTNPTGISYTQAELDALVREVESRGAWLLSDEVFAQVGGAERVPSILASPDGGSQRVIFGGVSKTFAAGGLRVGWMVSPHQRLVEGVRNRRLESPPRYALLAVRELLLAALDGGESGVGEWLRLQAHHLAAQRQRVIDTLEKVGISVVGGGSALSVLVDLSAVVAPARADHWVEMLEKEAGVRINTPSWSATPGMARVCLSISTTQMEEGLRRLVAYVQGTRLKVS